MANVTNKFPADRVFYGVTFPAGKAVHVEDVNLLAKCRQLPRAFDVDDTAEPPKKRGRPKGSTTKKRVTKKRATRAASDDAE